MKTAVIYARNPCDAQSEQSIEGQLRFCQKYAKDHDMLFSTIINTVFSTFPFLPGSGFFYFRRIFQKGA